MRRFYAPPQSFSDDSVSLTAEETRHIRDVLRLREGGEISVFDGVGGEFLCRIANLPKSGAVLTIVGKISPASPESPLELTLAVALLKGEKFDLVIQKAVELGVSTLQPLSTKRCDVKPNIRDNKAARWQKIALEAAKQSGRATSMQIKEPLDLAAFIKSGEAGAVRILFTERSGAGFESIPPGNKITAFVGPEGGWDDSELELAKENGLRLVTLGGRILRAETAALCVAAILQHRFGDLS